MHSSAGRIDSKPVGVREGFYITMMYGMDCSNDNNHLIVSMFSLLHEPPNGNPRASLMKVDFVARQVSDIRWTHELHGRRSAGHSC